MSDEGSKRETHDSELVGLSKCASVLAILDHLGELNENGLLLAKLVGEARDSEYQVSFDQKVGGERRTFQIHRCLGGHRTRQSSLG